MWSAHENHIVCYRSSPLWLHEPLLSSVTMSKPEHEKKLTFSPSSSIGEQIALAQPNSHDSSTNSPTSKTYSFTISYVLGILLWHIEGERLEQKSGIQIEFFLIRMENPTAQVVLLERLYRVDYMFHVAIYQSLSPSEGVAMNILSTQEDIAYLKKQHVLPSTRFV